MAPGLHRPRHVVCNIPSWHHHEADRRHERTERTFSVLWLVVGGALLGTPLSLKRRVWQLGWPMNGIRCGIATRGLLLSGMGALVCVANGLKQKWGLAHSFAVPVPIFVSSG